MNIHRMITILIKNEEIFTSLIFFMIDSLTDKENIEHLMHVMKQKEDDIGNSYEINKDFQTFERNR